MDQTIPLEEVLAVIDQTLDTYHMDRDRISSLTEHVHHQSAIDALLILKSQFKLRSRMH